MTREPAVAGKFYPSSPEALKNEIGSFIDAKAQKKSAIGVVSPHAGYIYSGPVAAAVFSRVEIPPTVVILGPNHTGIGHTFSIYKKGRWRMPSGDVEIDTELADAICKATGLVLEDERAHGFEHSLEVQLPFIQYFKDDFRIVPIVLGTSSLNDYKEVADAIAQSVKAKRKGALIVASSDMTHYETQEAAEAKDRIAIDAMLKLDAALLLKEVNAHNITMCGVVPAACMLLAAKSLGAKSAALVKYQTSGDRSGDYSAVVGYAGIIVE